MAGLSGDLGANEIIRLLRLTPHPEGGHYTEVYRAEGDGRAACTTIYYLLQADEVSAWHRVDADEVWAWHAGGPLSLTLSPPDGKGASAHTLGPELRAGQEPHIVVPKLHWQTAE
ncbi:MAG: cupin domain-containing protein, partial [Henriciella sp.]|uniref:cupin domain-containing protein n=1 Tax=Henriciella sp. TaxID=1968823 RepID=UPI003C752126